MSNDRRTRDEAWVGDAVLALYARQWILAEPSIAPSQRAECFKQMTSNHFLASFGEPTAVEAAIGRIYQTDGLQPAFDWMESELLPLFKKQRAQARRPGNYRQKN